jgi:hypothetical protein
VKALVVLLALAAALLAGSAAMSLGLEARLYTLAPGGLTVSGLGYDPFSGRLALRGVTARDAAGREIFRAAAVEATLRIGALLGGPLTLQRIRLEAPRLVIAPAPALTLIGLGDPGAEGLPVVVDGLVVNQGALIVEEPEHGRAFVARDLSARLDRFAAFAEGDAAFALDTALYRSTVHITGQPIGRGAYALRIRARGLDAPALLQDFPQLLGGIRARITAGRADIDATVLVAGSRAVASGQIRLAQLVARFPDALNAPLTAAALVLALDRWDLNAGTGRISRLELQRPSFTVGVERGTPGALRALLDRLGGPGVALRRLRIVDGTVRVVTAERPLTLRGVTLGLQSAAESGPHAGFVLTARAGLGAEGRLTLDGALSRDLRRAQGAVRAIDVTLEGCGITDLSVPLPDEATPRAVLDALTVVGCGRPRI